MRNKSAPKRVWSPESNHAYMLSRIARADARNRRTLRAFAEWLATSRGLSPGTITLRIASASTFVDAVTLRAGKSCARTFRAMTAQGIEDFFVEYSQSRGMAARRSMRAAMRWFLEFVAGRGWVDRELADAVPRLRGYRLSGLPRGVSDEQLSRLLKTPWKGTPCVRRDRAIVWLFATYGVRREQVSGLQFDDIDWHEKTITFAAHKGGKAVQHVLTEAVAQTLADYLYHDRPPSECPFIFLRHLRPHVRLGPSAISAQVRARTQSCGLPPLHPHAFRHAFATRLLRNGESIKAIADLLGHRSLATVAVYAKVDYARLIKVAVAWPEAGS